MKHLHAVTASEVGEYVYCKRAWWLRFNNLTKTTPFMQDGTEKHESLVLFLTNLRVRIVLARLIILLGLFVLLMTGIMFLLKKL